MHSLIFHVDVNSAFLSWESAKRLRDNPDALDLRTINAVIGGDEKMRHGVVLAKSPSAKKYGIMTGEPLSHARQNARNLSLFRRIMNCTLLPPESLSAFWKRLPR